MVTFPTIGQEPWGATLNTALAQMSSDPQPSDHNVTAWAFAPQAAVGTQNPTAGVLHLTKVLLRAAGTITNVITGVSAAGVGLTANQNFGALYDSTGTRVGVTADQSVAWASSGTKIMALTAPYVAAAGFYWVAILSNAGTSTPTIPRTLNNSSMINNLGSTTATSWSATTGAGLTATPASFTPGTITPNSITLWAAIS